MRTYTPLQWAGTTTSFLAFVHGDGPGASWARDARVGDEVQLFGPRRSLDVSDVSSPLVVLGDETSVALALALSRARPERKVSAVLEVQDRAEVRGALDAMGSLVDAHLVEKAAGLDTLTSTLEAVLDTGAFALFSGRAATIQGVKQRVRARTVPSKTKAYWAEGKRGLD
jgi:NADPH-dependent ferric siderophore reductase